ncbi:hypothetical protein LMH87_004274 [Akanthomyces muscarius]|uniref:Uncharacterized protein n=1 Tax=Akanthomyces muscarius TaxID=2231603 RepID=A0A9W8UFG7_AKAMU|nr:hypothetical protein LMH87_004274 [Akanthomyces muscarius]KAJ4145422.1 hypothetical protein LMH87_004274 [Akanthomyces muscarius]
MRADWQVLPVGTKISQNPGAALLSSNQLQGGIGVRGRGGWKPARRTEKPTEKEATKENDSSSIISLLLLLVILRRASVPFVENAAAEWSGSCAIWEAMLAKLSRESQAHTQRLSSPLLSVEAMYLDLCCNICFWKLIDRGLVVARR